MAIYGNSHSDPRDLSTLKRKNGEIEKKFYPKYIFCIVMLCYIIFQWSKILYVGTHCESRQSTAQRLSSIGDTQVPGLSTNIIEVNEKHKFKGRRLVQVRTLIENFNRTWDEHGRVSPRDAVATKNPNSQHYLYCRKFEFLFSVLY